MVRPSDQRKRMYEAKVDPEILATQTRVLKALMVREETRYFPVITTIEEKVKKLVEAEGVPTLQVRDYLNFGREMYELTQKFTGTTLTGEAQLRVNKWSSRGLTGSLLIRIAHLFGVKPSPPPTPPSILDLINLGYFPMMLGEVVPSPYILESTEGEGYNKFQLYGWVVNANPDQRYVAEIKFGVPFRKLPLYLTKLRFNIFRPYPTDITTAYVYFYVMKQIDGGSSEMVLEGELFNDDILQGENSYSYPISPPKLIEIDMGFEFSFNVILESTSPVTDCMVRIYKCFLESKLVI